MRVVGTDRAITPRRACASREGPELLTAFDDSFEQPEPTYPNGTHIAEVEIDPETGVTTIVGY